jgi:two-component system phosphate regulon response regulator OmpR
MVERSAGSVPEQPELPLILVVDDEAELRSLLAEYLGQHGFRLQLAAHAGEARQLIGREPPALALLDVNMPGENGLSLARWLREAHPTVAIVMLTTASDTIDRIVGLELGADDYLPKPFELRELLARIRAVLRRSRMTPPPAAVGALATAASPVGSALSPTADGALPDTGMANLSGLAAGRRVRFGERWLDLDQRRLLDTEGQEIEITAAEFDLLALFASHPNRPLNRDQIMEQAHHRGWEVFDRSIDLRVMRLRRKIERNPDKPEIIKTVRNVGYVFVPGH